MRRVLFVTVVFCAIGILARQTVAAQEPLSIEDEGGVDLVIEKALDQIEKSIDPADTKSKRLSIEPVISGVSRPEIKEDVPVIVEDEAVVDLQEGPDDPIPVDSDETVVAQEEAYETGSADETFEAEEVQPEDLRDVKIIPIMHAEASGLVEMLQQMKSSDGEVSYNEEDGTVTLKDLPGQLEAMSAFIKEVDIPLETAIFAFEYILAGDVVDEIGEALTEKIGQIQSNEEENSVVVTDTPLKIGEIKELVKKLDRYNVGITIETRILQIVLNDEHLEGVDWEAIVSDYKALPLSEAAGENTKPFSVGTVSREDYKILLEALDTVGAMRTVFEEEIKADNETTGVVTGFATSGVGDASEFRVTATAKQNKPFEVLVQTRGENNEGVTVNMDDGATIVIGTSFEEAMVSSTWKIPLLGDLPLLGFVFRNEAEKSRKAENIIFLTVKSISKNIL